MHLASIGAPRAESAGPDARRMRISPVLRRAILPCASRGSYRRVYWA